MTRLDKIAQLKSNTISNGMDLYKVSDEDLSKLIKITDQQKKKIPLAAGDYVLLNQLKENHPATAKKLIGRFN